jgi:hypothetical protein
VEHTHERRYVSAPSGVPRGGLTERTAAIRYVQDDAWPEWYLRMVRNRVPAHMHHVVARAREELMARPDVFVA